MTHPGNTETPANVVRVQADHTVTKHLGNWTTARTFEVRARRGAAVIDLRSPGIADGDIELHMDIDHGMVKLLLPVDATVDHWGLQWAGAGKVKDGEGANVAGGRRVRIAGRVVDGEIRIHRGGMAMLSAMFSRAYLEDLKRARRDRVMPTVDDPARTS
ncbi:hypothetical protein [Micromonospora sp. RTP1Z1]|uniref:hypothetical protein n=1 Tax=Micromonospora sp. RTP1Z1 TaxID=2994043 RepID=UPI0029C81207|nr:hypothetical protein [Micromonospora sp. RTP1Z1]